MIDLEVPGKLAPLVSRAAAMADQVFRPISRKYDLAEHEYPRELDLVSAVIDGMSESGVGQGAGAKGSTKADKEAPIAGVCAGRREAAAKGNKNGANLSSVLSIMQTCSWPRTRRNSSWRA